MEDTKLWDKMSETEKLDLQVKEEVLKSVVETRQPWPASSHKEKEKLILGKWQELPTKMNCILASWISSPGQIQGAYTSRSSVGGVREEGMAGVIK